MLSFFGYKRVIPDLGQQKSKKEKQKERNEISRNSLNSGALLLQQNDACLQSSHVCILSNESYKSNKDDWSDSNKISNKVDASDNMATYLKCLFHDFRGPLNNIVLAVNILEDEIAPNHSSYSIVMNIKDSCECLTKSLNGFLNVQDQSDTMTNSLVLKKQPFNIVGMINIIFVKRKTGQFFISSPRYN